MSATRFLREHACPAIRRAWYLAFGLPELRAKVWLHPRAPLLQRLRGDRRATVSRIELPADLTPEERRQLIAELHNIADVVARDVDP